MNKSSSALLYVILSPVGPYFKTGTFSPVALLADPSFVRAWPGGCGDSKMGGYVTLQRDNKFGKQKTHFRIKINFLIFNYRY